jgi:hypothetical protein
MNNDSKFIGTIITNNAIDLKPGLILNGRALTTNGALTTNSITATISSSCTVTSTATAINSFSSGISDKTISIYPNPFSSTLSVDLSNVQYSDPIQIAIYSVQGELVMMQTLSKTTNFIETNALASGLYFYKIIAEAKLVSSGRLISQK